jgi:rhodanese-related sulfurtransferase
VDGEHRISIDEMLVRARARVRRLSPVEAWAMVGAGDGVLVDVRTADQQARDGLIPGALTISLNVLEWRMDPDSPARLPEITGTEQPIVILCEQGYCSSLAAARLQDLGFARASDVIGGAEAWRAAGLPMGVATAT